MSGAMIPRGLGVTAPAATSTPQADAFAQLTTLQTLLTTAGTRVLTATEVAQAATALQACADDVNLLAGAQIPPGTWVSGGVAAGGVAAAGLLAGLGGYFFGKGRR